MIGRVIGNYQITSELARGGMGTVYRGHHLTLPREVVVKSILLAPFSSSAQVHLKARFRREAYIQSQLDHPNIVRVYEFFTGEDNYYLVMEYVAGVTLRELLSRQGVPTPAQAVYLFKQALSALDYAHKFSYLDESDNRHMGVIHRDIKPANMLLDTKGKLKITDFGIAKVMGEQGTGGGMTATGFQPGTVEYMSPEQIRGEEVDERSDLYSLGVTLYEMLTGRLPFPRSATGSDWEVRKGHMEMDPPPIHEARPGIHASLAAIVMRSLSKNVNDRYQTAGEFLEALRTYEHRYGANGGTKGAAEKTAMHPLIVATNVDSDVTRPRRPFNAAAPMGPTMPLTSQEETPTIALEAPPRFAPPAVMSATIPLFPAQNAAPANASAGGRWKLAAAGLGLLLAGTASGAYLVSRGRENGPQANLAVVGAPSPSPSPSASASPMAKASPKPRPSGTPNLLAGELSAFRQARVLEGQEKYTDAIQVLEKYLMNNPGAPDKSAVDGRISDLKQLDAALVSADAAMNAGRYQVAARAYTTAIRLRPESQRAKAGLERALAKVPDGMPHRPNPNGPNGPGPNPGFNGGPGGARPFQRKPLADGSTGAVGMGVGGATSVDSGPPRRNPNRRPQPKPTPPDSQP